MSVHNQLEFCNFGCTATSSVILQIIKVCFESLVSNLSLSSLSRLSRTCKTLAFMLRHESFLDYVTKFLPLLNAMKTRNMFLLPITAKLTRISHGKYNQHSAFQLSLIKNKNLTGIRRKHEQRKKRKEKIQQIKEIYLKRMTCLKNALQEKKLPEHYMWNSFESTIIRHYARWSENELFNFIMEQNVNKLCRKYWLQNYTDFATALNHHIALFGDYELAALNVARRYISPNKWPWID